MAQDLRAAARGRFERWFEVEVVDPMADFQNPKQNGSGRAGLVVVGIVLFMARCPGLT